MVPSLSLGNNLQELLPNPAEARAVQFLPYVLDLGCNVGHLTLSIACKWGPSRMVGLDIDPRLIHSARQNIRHYLSEELRLPPQPSEGDPGAESEEGTTTVQKRSCFPASLTASRGPIAAPQVPLDGADTSVFPNNVVFVTVRGCWVRGQVRRD